MLFEQGQHKHCYIPNNANIALFKELLKLKLVKLLALLEAASHARNFDLDHIILRNGIVIYWCQALKKM